MNSCGVIGIGLLLMFSAGCTETDERNSHQTPSETEVPAVDTADMEAEVRDRIDARLRELRHSVDSAQHWGDAGRLLHAHDLLLAAVQCYRRAMSLDPNHFDWPYLAARAVARYDATEALVLFERAANINSEFVPLQIAIGELETRLGRIDPARSAFQRARTLGPTSAAAAVGLARLAMLEGDLLVALDLLNEARARWPRTGQIYSLLAQVHSRLGELELARLAEWGAGVYAKSLTLPDDPLLQAVYDLAEDSRSHALRGKQFAQRGELEKAEVHLRRVLEIRDGTPDDYGNLATVLARQGRYDEAFPLFDAGLQLNADDASLLAHLGLAQLQAGKPDLAETTLEKAVSLDPSHPTARFNLGALRASAGDYARAIVQFEAVLAIDRSFTDAFLNLGTSYAMSGDLPGALSVWSELRELQPDRPALLQNIARVQFRLGQRDEAVETLEALKALRSPLPEHQAPDW